jgi:serine/threonine protein kinase
LCSPDELVNHHGTTIRGAFSVVKLAVNKKTKEKVAIKVIDRANVGKDYEKNLLMEMEILQRVHHPNIIQLHEMIEEDNKIYFAMELYVFHTWPFKWARGGWFLILRARVCGGLTG